jgi:hypothetical protein
VGSHGNTRDLQVGFNTDKGNSWVGFDVDKDTHKVHWGLGYVACVAPLCAACSTWDRHMVRCCMKPAVNGARRCVTPNLSHEHDSAATMLFRC